MSTQCTITGEQTSRTHGLVDTVEPCMFEGDVHELLHGFRADVEKAYAHLRPLLFGLIRRRGQVRFAILPEGSPLERAYKKDGYLVSTIKFKEDVVLTKSELERAIRRIKELRIARINGLESHSCVDGPSITFHVDLEAA